MWSSTKKCYHCQIDGEHHWTFQFAHQEPNWTRNEFHPKICDCRMKACTTQHAVPNSKHQMWQTTLFPLKETRGKYSRSVTEWTFLVYYWVEIVRRQASKCHRRLPLCVTRLWDRASCISNVEGTSGMIIRFWTPIQYKVSCWAKIFWFLINEANAHMLYHYSTPKPLAVEMLYSTPEVL